MLLAAEEFSASCGFVIPSAEAMPCHAEGSYVAAAGAGAAHSPPHAHQTRASSDTSRAAELLPDALAYMWQPPVASNDVMQVTTTCGSLIPATVKTVPLTLSHFRAVSAHSFSIQSKTGATLCSQAVADDVFLVTVSGASTHVEAAILMIRNIARQATSMAMAQAAGRNADAWQPMQHCWTYTVLMALDVMFALLKLLRGRRRA